MISLEKPKQFDDPMEVVGCFLENNGKILLLHRQSHKPEGGTWCSVGGKVEATDTSQSKAIQREVKEETGVWANKEDFELIATFYITYPDGKNFIYHKFRLQINDANVQLVEDEHQEHKWLQPKEALELPLIQHEGDTIKYTYSL